MSKRLFVNDLPSDTDIAKVPIRVPDDVFKNKNYTGPKTQIVYMRSSWLCGIWVTEKIKDTRIYPIMVLPYSILEWEVDESYGNNGK